MPQCTRCHNFPCTCTDSRDVVADYYAQTSRPPECVPLLYTAERIPLDVMLRGEPHEDCDCISCLPPTY